MDIKAVSYADGTPAHLKNSRFALANHVRDLGFESMGQLVKLSGESHQTLINWSKRYPERFEYIVAGVKLKHKIFMKYKK